MKPYITIKKVACMAIIVGFMPSISYAESYVEKMSRLDREFEMNKKEKLVQKQREDIARSRASFDKINDKGESALKLQRQMAKQNKIVAQAAQQSAALAAIKVIRTYKIGKKGHWEALIVSDAGEQPVRKNTMIPNVGKVVDINIGGIYMRPAKANERSAKVMLPVMKKRQVALGAETSEKSPALPIAPSF